MSLILCSRHLYHCQRDVCLESEQSPSCVLHSAESVQLDDNGLLCLECFAALALQASGNERQMSLLKCLIHSMYDEIRFLHDYPDHELDRTARLLGAVIRNG